MAHIANKRGCSCLLPTLMSMMHRKTCHVNAFVTVFYGKEREENTVLDLGCVLTRVESILLNVCILR